MSGLIERICEGHKDPDPDGPHITMVDGVWAYCAGHATEGHIWRTIAATTREQLEREQTAPTS